MMPQGAPLLHYTETPDWRNAVVEFGEIAAKTAQILNFTLDGIPFVFAGQEIAERMPVRHWTRSPTPVLVYIFGGGFQNGAGSEPRYDGESMATQASSP